MDALSNVRRRLEQKKALDLVVQSLNLDSAQERRAGLELITSLGSFALPLQQATVYIAHCAASLPPPGGGTIVSHIENYMKKLQDMTTTGLATNDDDDYEKSVTSLTTRMTLDKIKGIQMQRASDEASRLLTMLAYLEPDLEFCVSMLLLNDFMTEEKLQQALHILEQFCLVSKTARSDSGNSCSVHQVVQQVVRQQNESAEISTLDDLLTIFSEIMGKMAPQNSSNRSTTSCTIAHVRSVWCYALNHPSLLLKFFEFPVILFGKGDEQGMYSENLAMIQSTARKYDELCSEITDFETYFKVKSSVTIALAKLKRFKEAKANAEGVYGQVVLKFGESHPTSLRLLGHLASVLCGEGNYANALPIYDRIYEVQSNAPELGPSHSATLTTRHNKGFALMYLGRNQEALELLKSTLDLELQLNPPNLALTSNTQNVLAQTLKNLGNFKEALEMYEIVLGDRKSRLGESHPNTLDSALESALCLVGLGKLSEGLDLLRKSLELGQRNPNAKTVCTDLKLEIGRVLGQMEHFEEAISMVREGLGELEGVLGAGHPRVLTTRNELEQLLGKMRSCRESEGNNN